jgi:hypothetical protein
MVAIITLIPQALSINRGSLKSWAVLACLTLSSLPLHH